MEEKNNDKDNNVKFISAKTILKEPISIAAIGKKTKSHHYLETELQYKELTKDLDSNSTTDKNQVEVISENLLKVKLEEVAQKTVPSNKARRTLWSIFFLLINILVVYFLAKSLFTSADDATISNLIAVQGASLNYLWLGLLLYVIIIIADALFIYVMLNKIVGVKRFGLSVRTSITGKYFEAITPLAAGGQPSQIVYMVKRKISPGAATSIPIMRVTILNFINIIFSLAVFIFVVPNITYVNGFIDILTGILKILAYIGIFVNTLFLLGMLIIANSKVFGRVLARSVLKFLCTLHIVKNFRRAYKKLMKQVSEFQNSIQYLNKNFWLLVCSIVLIAVEVIAYASIPFVIALALSETPFFAFSSMTSFWLETIALYYICYMASAYVPLPGGTGMMEISFIILFTPIIGANFVVWAFLIWRILTYYINIINGFVLTIGDMAVGTIKKPIVKLRV